MIMSDKQHVSSKFEQSLAGVRDAVLEMADLVQLQISEAIACCTAGDISEVDSIIDRDQQVNDFEKRIDHDCAEIIALRQPTASDLRFLMGTSKLVSDLERAGDAAKKIARRSRRIVEAGHHVSAFGVGVRHISEAAQEMLADAVDAYRDLDIVAAEAVIAADSAVDSEFKAIMRQLITHMMEDSRTISPAMELVGITRSFERIGDCAKNLAEHVIYIVEGRDIRHGPKEADA
jgi:phosphate transport system protein